MALIVAFMLLLIASIGMFFGRCTLPIESFMEIKAGGDLAAPRH